MEKIGTYKIIYDKHLIVEYYNGIITAGDLIHFKNVIRKEPNYDFYSNTILDFRDCVLEIKKVELHGILEFFRTNFEKAGIRNTAYLTSKPNEVVLATLYSHLVKDSELNYNLSVFSTEKAAAEMFGEKVISEEGLHKILSELKTKSNNVFAK